MSHDLFDRALSSRRGWIAGPWQAASLMVLGLIERDQAATRFVLTEQGRAVLAAMLGGENR